jgi:hypothetical protein
MFFVGANQSNSAASIGAAREKTSQIPADPDTPASGAVKKFIAFRERQGQNSSF